MENKMTGQEIENKIKIFCETKTPTFLKVKSQNSYKIYNGFIKSINGSYIMFEDIKIGNYPIMKSDIIFVDVSNYREFKEGKNGSP